LTQNYLKLDISEEKKKKTKEKGRRANKQGNSVERDKTRRMNGGKTEVQREGLEPFSFIVKKVATTMQKWGRLELERGGLTGGESNKRRGKRRTKGKGTKIIVG